MSRKIFVIALVCVLALSSLACSLTVNLPVEKVTTGPNREEEINVPAPDVAVADLTLAFGAGDLEVEGGAEDALVSGKASYNVDDFKPKVVLHEDGKVSLETGNLNLNGIPTFKGKIENRWDLQLGDYPLDLTVNAGAYQANLDLGDLSLRSLTVNDGAADVRLQFSEPNRIEMERLTYTTGASNVRLKGLANANFAEMSFQSGAGDYTLDFSGELKRDGTVSIDSGISNLVLIVPDGVSARLTFDGGMTSIKTGKGWEQNGQYYVHAGEGPTLIITVKMSAGNLTLRSN